MKPVYEKKAVSFFSSYRELSVNKRELLGN